MVMTVDKLDLILEKLNDIDSRLRKLENNNGGIYNIKESDNDESIQIDEPTQDNATLMKNTGLSHKDLHDLFKHLVNFGFKGYETRIIVSFKDMAKFISENGHRIRHQLEQRHDKESTKNQQETVPSQSKEVTKPKKIIKPLRAISPPKPKPIEKPFVPENPEQYNKFLSLGGSPKRYKSLLESGANIDEVIKLMESE
jgi:hypothetical protein